MLNRKIQGELIDKIIINTSILVKYKIFYTSGN